MQWIANSAARKARPWSPRRNRRSTSLLCSIAVHLAGLILLLLILAPADFGGTGMATFFLAVDQSVADQEPTVFDASLGDLLPSGTGDQSPSPDALLKQTLLSGMGSLSDDPMARRSSYARGSFFGIEAGGHEFVYVLDKSGSMRGRRFDRATDELVRSVEQLGPHQSFYVLLFSTGTAQLFGRDDLLPRPVVATTENKERLKKWLSTTSQGGSTDPREALQVAMRMNPSAIFMLSDGEFNGKKRQTKDGLLGGNADAFAIVEAASTKTPIHSIAFEDRRSRANMQRLADITAGEFRFVPLKDGIDPAVSIQNARNAIAQAELPEAKLYIRQAIRSIANEDADAIEKLKRDASTVLLEIAKKGHAEGELDSARMALKESVQLDPKGTFTAEAQEWLVDLLLKQLREPGSPKEDQVSVAFFSDLLGQFPSSEAAKQIGDPLARSQLEKARQSYQAGRVAHALRNLEFVITSLDKTDVYKECLAEHERIAGELTREITALKAQADVASIKRLCQLNTNLQDTLLSEQVTQALRQHAREMLVAARDAGLQGNPVKRSEIHRAISNGFGEAPLLIEARKRLVLDERRAQMLMRAAMQQERTSRIAAAEKYRQLIHSYSDTTAARVATERLRFVGR